MEAKSNDELLLERIEELKESIESTEKRLAWHKENPKVWRDGGRRNREWEEQIRENSLTLGWLEELREFKGLGSHKE